MTQQTQHRSPLKKWAIWLGKAVLLAIYALIVTEIFLRVVDPQAIMPRYVTGSEWGVRTNIAGAEYRHTTPETNVEFRINDQHMRDDRTYPMAEPADTCRIGLFGDSYFMGYELPLDQSIHKRLEAGLSNAGYKVEVLNFAVSGLGTAESLKTYLERGRQFDLDHVLLEWQVTDFDDNSRSGLYALGEDGSVSAKNDSYLPSIGIQDRLQGIWLYRVLQDHSHTYNFVREEAGWRAKQLLALFAKRSTGEASGADTDASDLNAGRIDTARQKPADRDSGAEERKAAPNKNGAVPSGGYTVTPKQRELALALIKKMDAEVADDGGQLIVADIPNRDINGKYGSSMDLIDLSKFNQDRIVETKQAFRDLHSQTGRNLFYTTGAKHLNPEGAQLFADLVAKAMIANGGLSSCQAK